MTMIAHNLQQVRAQLVKASIAAGRLPTSVALLAVSKTWGADAVLAAIAADQWAFGENYIQEAVEKITQVRTLVQQQGWDAARLRWHCIGPIQSNKTRLVAEHFDWVHTVDRLKTAQRLSEQRPPHLPPLQVCLQINVDGGPTKSGVAPDELLALALAVVKLPRLTLRGVMSMPDPVQGFDAQQQVHQRAQQAFEHLRQSLASVPTPDGQPASAQCDTLSMGMSDDWEAAVHAGSTMVRMGSRIFGARS